MAETNPYRAPQAAVEDLGSAGGALAAEPQRVDAGRGVAWISEGWALFRQAPLMWIAITLIGFVVFVVLAFIPLLGHLATTLLTVFFGGGIMLGCRTLDSGAELGVGHLFAGFERHTVPLATIGALYLGAVLVLMLVFALIGGASLLSWSTGDRASIPMSFLLAMLVFLALLVPVAMALWFAPGLATLNDVPPVEAMRLSFIGCLRNIVPFLVYGVLLLVLSIIASIPFGLGWLVLPSVIAGSIYAGYKDIFLRR